MLFRRFFRLDANLLNDSIPSTTLPVNPVISLFTNMLMKHGRKEKAQFYLSKALVYVRSKTNNDPVALVTQAVDLAAPLVVLQSRKIGSKVIQSPKALTNRQRMHHGIKFIIQASDKRNERSLGDRLGAEIVGVLSGNSSSLEKKNQIHKLALANRSNMRLPRNKSTV